MRLRGVTQNLELFRCRDTRIEQHGNPTYVLECLHKKLETLAVQFGRKNTDPRDVASWTRKRTHQPSSDHIIGNSQDGDAPRSGLRSVYRRIASGQNDIGSGRNKLDRKRWKTVLSGLEAARIDGQMLSLNDSELPQLVEERL